MRGGMLNFEDIGIHLTAMTALVKAQQKEIKELEEKYELESEESLWLLEFCLKNDWGGLIQAVRTDKDLSEAIKTKLFQFFEENGYPLE